MPPLNTVLLEKIHSKGLLNNEVVEATLKVFGRFKLLLQQFEKALHQEVNKDGIKTQFTDRGTYEVELRVADDVLIFIMHTNAFVFEPSNAINKTGYVTSDITRATCGMISIYNFLSDSIKFERNHDIGQLIGRIFINKEQHFFVEGKKQLGVMFNDYANSVATDENIQLMIETFLQYSIDVDITIPPFEWMKEITVSDAMTYTIQTTAEAGKRLGFKFQNEKPDMKS